MAKQASKGPDFLSTVTQAAIRNAYAARGNGGHVVLLGQRYIITKMKKRVSFIADGEVKSQTEHWLSVRPADGTLVPCANIELKHQGNMRTVKAK